MSDFDDRNFSTEILTELSYEIGKIDRLFLRLKKDGVFDFNPEDSMLYSQRIARLYTELENVQEIIEDNDIVSEEDKMYVVREINNITQEIHKINEYLRDIMQEEGRTRSNLFGMY